MRPIHALEALLLLLGAASAVRNVALELEDPLPTEKHEQAGKEEVEFDYKQFQTGTWSSVDTHKRQNACSGSEADGASWQSPINIDVEGVTYDKVPKADLPSFHARNGGCAVAYFKPEPTDWKVVFQEPAYSVNCTRLGMQWKNKSWGLVQLHFHVLAEDMLDFTTFPMQMHLVHSNGNSLAVVGVFVNVGRSENSFLQQIFKAGFASNRTKELLPGDRLFNPYEVLDEGGKFFNYQGSLTQPPCTPKVDFLIAKDPVSTARSNIRNYMAYLVATGRGDSYGKNNRPIQPLNGRPIRVGTWGPTVTDAQWRWPSVPSFWELLGALTA